MLTKFISLKEKGYVPDTILDIGAYIGTWTDDMMKIYRNSNYYLFEANDYHELNKFRFRNNIKIFNVILNDKTEEVDWYQKKTTGDSMFKEKSHHFVNCKAIKKNAIDLNSYISQNNLLQDSKNIFIKIDCQGAEISILKGATDILNKTDFIVLEIPFFGQYNEKVPNFLEHIQFMDNIGFIPYDIVDTHYVNGYNMQIDMLFINKNHHFNIDVDQKLLVL